MTTVASCPPLLFPPIAKIAPATATADDCQRSSGSWVPCAILPCWYPATLQQCQPAGPTPPLTYTLPLVVHAVTSVRWVGIGVSERHCPVATSMLSTVGSSAPFPFPPPRT